jgi:hypothetical protein
MEEKKDESSSSPYSETTTTTISVLAAACSSGDGGGGRKRGKRAAKMDILDSLTTIRSTRTRRGGGGGSSSTASAAAAAAATTKKGPSSSSKIARPPENSLALVAATASTAAAAAAAAAPPIKKHPAALQRAGRGKKNVKQLLRRRGSTASAASSSSAAAEASSLPVPQKQQQPLRRRQTSSTFAAASTVVQQQQQQQQQNQQQQRRKQRKLPVIIVESDKNPRRLVNPLTEWPPCTVVAAVPASAGAAGAAGASDTITALGPTDHAAGISPSNSAASAGSNVQACELWPLQDIFHPLPDTYSIAYMARLLGFQLPPPPVAAPNSLTNNCSYKPVPLPANLELERDNGYQNIPRRGTFIDAVYKNGKRHLHGTATCDADDCRTLDVLDPLYEALLLHNDDDHTDGNTTNDKKSAEGATTNATTRQRPSLCSSSSSSSSFLAMTKSVTSAHQQRLSQAGTVNAAWSDTLQLARTYLVTADEDDNSSNNNNNIGAGAAVMTNSSSMNESSRSGPSTSSSSLWKVSTLADFQREQQQLQEQPEQNPNPPPPPVPLTSSRLPEFLTNSKKPVANECGIFLWNNKSGSINIDTADSATEDLLVGVVMYQFVWYCHGNNQAGVVLNIRDICNAPGVSCLDERNYTVVDDNQQEQEKHPETAATTAPLSMPQLLLLTSLVLQHARAAQVWYVTLLVPSRLQGFFATFFRMVPSAKSVSSSPPTTTTMVRMVCDLNKCSTRYAFLMYQQYKGMRNVLDMIQPKEEEAVTTTTTPFRALVRLPNVDEVRVALKPPTIVAPLRSNNKRTASSNGTNNGYFTSASSRMRQVAVGVRAQFSPKATAEYNDDNDTRGGHEQDDAGRELHECSLLQLDPVSRQVGDPIDLPAFYAEPRYACVSILTAVMSSWR